MHKMTCHQRRKDKLSHGVTDVCLFGTIFTITPYRCTLTISGIFTVATHYYILDCIFSQRGDIVTWYMFVWMSYLSKKPERMCSNNYLFTSCMSLFLLDTTVCTYWDVACLRRRKFTLECMLTQLGGLGRVNLHHHLDAIPTELPLFPCYQEWVPACPSVNDGDIW